MDMSYVNNETPHATTFFDHKPVTYDHALLRDVVPTTTQSIHFSMD
jgi:hypothetical protein